ncbi:rhodanese-like domain-containing protein [Microbacterium limosum]|uniref:Rhodanese-like domain-containing protein n=1 Tax=Microbacterium limosum TaxID=3079935 RepID=A0AAU0MGA3_9MICO|nr:rhodanese-like domain-containing protein [Microbacterium sp. Y20]WOQ69603.1 rhodanese-like domain-containing protein [Microbacterium sp. Y20]
MWKRRSTEFRLTSGAGVTLMPRRSLRAVALGAALALSVVMSGCAATAPGSIVIGDDTVVVDVRTPAEYAGGHLDGAINIDFQSPQFDAAIAELDPDDEYVVYCQTGNRSAQAVAAMEDAGLDVQDAGGISEAEQATGLAIVQ